ncbi:phosphate ABC transporter permease subunit PstC [Poriferisphaera sp. WC338]|uniref:phosphate ABC transporter permease subunit PstC n=1 Tax=Poriferisphaera sp. WC338 TaxID=3425129 RepID=UPI003D812B11
MTTLNTDMTSTSKLANIKSRSKTARKIREFFILGALITCGLFSLSTTILIIYVLAKEAISFFNVPEVHFVDFITGLQWNPLLGAEHHFGIWPLITGTMQVTVIAMCLALPLGLITAIWLSEYAHPKLRSIIKPVLEILAGIPTVVFGFFALTILTPALQWFDNNPLFAWLGIEFSVFNVTSAGLAVGIMCLPIVTSLTEDALRAVPRALREGAYGLGSTRFETSIKVVTPAALSGIIAAFLLAFARAVGETMIVALAAGGSPPQLNESLGNVVAVHDQTQTMTGYMVQIFLGDVSNFGAEYYSAYAVGATLFIITLTLTLIGNLIRVKFRQAYD